MKPLALLLLAATLTAGRQGDDEAPRFPCYSDAREHVADTGRAGTSPDVAILVMDDVGFDDVAGLSGEGLTPNIDALASRGVVFTRAYAHAWCAPSRDSLLRGVWDGRFHGSICQPASAQTLPSSVASLPREFRSRGYDTYLVGKYHLGLSRDHEDWKRAPEGIGFNHWHAGLSGPGKCIRNNHRIDDGVLSPDDRHHTTQQTEAFLQGYRRSREAGRPFFGMLAFTDAHSPWVVPTPETMPSDYRAPRNPTDREAFEAEIVGLDFAIGRILDALGPNTIIVLLGDNGTPRAVAPVPDHAKRSVYERGVHIPLVVAGPGFREGVASDRLVHIVDLAPTLTRTALEWQEGESFSETLASGGAEVGRDWVYVQNPSSGLRAVIGRRWKLIDQRGERNLFDLRSDPLEERPLAPEGEQAEQLTAIMDALDAS